MANPSFSRPIGNVSRSSGGQSANDTAPMADAAPVIGFANSLESIHCPTRDSTGLSAGTLGENSNCGDVDFGLIDLACEPEFPVSTHTNRVHSRK